MTSSTIRFAQFNASLNRNSEGQLVTDLSTPNNAQAKAVAEIIQRTNADVILINEFDYVAADPLSPVQLFQQNYLSVSQNGATPVEYRYAYIAPSNTGIASGFDLNNNGVTVTTPGTPGYGDDAFGFGNFPGQFGMLVLSKYPIDTANVRTFQNFLWKDMPNSLLPTVALPGSNTPWYSSEEQAVLRLSSKSHWDVPILVNGETIHFLSSHPTPPVFDGAEDRNGKRNHDEIRFWSDYITPGAGDYIYDDQGSTGGLKPGSKFVIAGDQNADPYDGDSFDRAVLQLLQNPAINTSFTPVSPGGAQQATLQGNANTRHGGNPAFDTADFADTTPGNLRADYVLPSSNQTIVDARVFWPLNTDPTFPLVGTFTPTLPGGFPSSDHRLVWVDVQTGAPAPGQTVVEAEFAGQQILPTGFVPAGDAGTINGVHVPLGGLSGIAYDAANNRFYSISDDRSQLGPARFYTLTIDLSSGQLSETGVNVTGVTTLKTADGQTFALNSIDPEGIALTRNNTVFISSEGEANPTAGRVSNPFVNEFDLATGALVRSLTIPRKFLPVFQDTNNSGAIDAGDQQVSGIRNNLAFESLTITPDGRSLFTATENALFQDGPVASISGGTRSRILQFNLVTGQAEGEFLYLTDAVAQAPNPATGFNTNGLVELLAIDNQGTFLALERSFSAGLPGTGNTIKLYQVSLQGATNISYFDSLNSLSPADLAAIKPVQKTLLLNLDDLELPTGTDNIEGISFGPTLADGRRSLILTSDNNFSNTQFTQILALDIKTLPTATPVVETPELLDDPEKSIDQQGDADDPAIYVNASDSAKSLVITVVKNAGLRVYDLGGRELQAINPGVTEENPEGIRYNNVDLLYGFNLGGHPVDLAIATDRRNDKIAIFKINPNATDGNYLEDISSPRLRTIFRPPAYEFQEFDEQSHAYGIASYKSPVSGKSYVFVNRRNTGDVAQLELLDAGDGTIRTRLVRSFTVPVPEFEGVEEAPEPQLEGMVVDQETGFLYIGQENVGIWKYQAEPSGGDSGVLIDRVKDLGGQHLEDDVEGLTIYYGPNGTGYLLASSQGDNTFAVYERGGFNQYLGSFAVGPSGSIDSVQESDGADVINLPLGPNFPFGLFVTQDGSNDPATLVEDDGELENISSNFKFVPWQNIAATFPEPLLIDTTGYDPRHPRAQSLQSVASGDTTDDSTVLWARTTFRGTVTFEYSTDADFSDIIGTERSRVNDPFKPVKVRLRGLEANTQYYYRVTDAAGDVETGKFKTAAEVGDRIGLRFGVTGDWQQAPPYPSLSNADDRDLTFFLKLGDTIYADTETPALPGITQARSLSDFRTKHAEITSTRFGQNTVRDLYASTSILATIDDHEVVDNFAGGAKPGDSPDAPDIGSDDDPLFTDAVDFVNDTQAYEDALQAFQEYHPIRDRFYGNTGDPRTAGERQLYRYNTYGSDAAMFVLDSRSFRDAQLAPASLANPVPFLVQAFDPSRTLLGRQQVEDLKRDLLKAERDGITWKFVAIPEPIQNFGVVNAEDRFEGYAAERTEILKFIDDHNIDNVVFLSGDFHGTLVNNLTYQVGPGQPQIAVNAFEVVTGPAAFFEGVFGRAVAQISAAAGLITPEQFAFYNSLPIAPDTDSIPNDQDDFVKQLLVAQTNAFGYDPIGLQNSNINARLLQGDYVVAHTYGWTEMNIDPDTQKLTVTTYGIPNYSEAELLADPTRITGLTPQIVSQFEVTPTQEGTEGRDRLTGFASDDVLRGGGGRDVLDGGLGNDTLFGGGDRDTFVLAANTGTDTIADFTPSDRIDLVGGLRFSDLAIAQGSGTQSSDALIRLASSNELLAIVTGVQASSLTRSVFI